MKISLFYKTLVISASFGLLFTFIPFGVSANSQNTQLLDTSSMLTDNFVKGTSVSIIEDQVLSSDFGFGIEALPSNEIVVYTVKDGDTLSEIAEYYDISTNTIRWENDISGKGLKVGQKLNILPVTGVKHIVKKGDTITKIADKYEAETEDILVFNGINKEDGLKQGDIIFVPNGIIKPVVVQKSSSSNKKEIAYSGSSSAKIQSGDYVRPAAGPITSPYGSRWGRFHYGIDIGNQRGAPVFAAASGKVVKTVDYCVEGKSSCGGRYGNYITLEHPNGLKTRYAHLSKLLVNLGDEVSQGQNIGLIGNTGRSTGPHVHFEVIVNGRKVNPFNYTK